MTKRLLYIALLVFTTTPGFSQAARKIDKMISLGLGLQTYSLGGVREGASFELGVTDQISAGGFLDYALFGTKVGNRQWKSQFVSIGVRGSYHLGGLLALGDRKFDPYAGLSAGTRSWLYRHQVDQNGYFIPRPRGFFPGFHVGGFYHFSKKIGGFAEMGLGVAMARLGITGKF
ncbi:hypothetical protein ACFPMF_13945 [Larkinella bovis]|uniref:DUF3575 domain-containing protein n=1 Tax=Larkinella bovis TaxID=683041 RepID=A0ABW0ICL8_9BACT